MQFKDKLDFLMKITQTSNKELAKGLSVDPSLISLLRSGKRKQPHNPQRINHMADYFASRCNADFQRNALSEMLGQTMLRSPMPQDALSSCLSRWLRGDSDMVEQILESINTIPTVLPPRANISYSPLENEKTHFFFGADGRREAVHYMTSIMQQLDKPCSIFMTMDDSLEWLLSDYDIAGELRSNLFKLIKSGFTFNQIMPAMNFVNRYTEALRFWLPLYGTGQIQVYYYPRLRDNLYRHSTVIIPGCAVQASTTIGLGSSNHITLVSRDPELIKAYTAQYQEHLSLCMPALKVHSDPEEYFPCLREIFSCPGDAIQMVSPLSVNTLPRELLQRCIEEACSPYWEDSFRMYLYEIPHFEERLKHTKCIDMSRLASPEEIKAGNVSIASRIKHYSKQPCYTTETYALHLENIVRLMDQYENYFFFPYESEPNSDYNLIVKEGGLALLVKTSEPPLMLEMHRPEMVLACREHLLRIAERTGYDGIERTKIRIQLQNLINELRKQ